MSHEDPILPDDQPEEEPVLSLIKQIKENKLNPKSLSAEERRRCVDVLGGEGYSIAEIAQIMQRGERTISRDRAEQRTAHALRPDPDFGPKMAGELIRQAECSMTRLRKIAREPGASAMERCMAENFAFKVFLDMQSKLQSMGYLVRIPNSVVAQVIGASNDIIPQLEQARQRLAELEMVDKELGITDPVQQEKRRALREIIEQGHTAAQVKHMIEKFGGGN